MRPCRIGYRSWNISRTWRCAYSTNTNNGPNNNPLKSPNDNHLDGSRETNPSLIVSNSVRAYMDRLHRHVQPRLTPFLQKAQATTHTLREWTQVNDSRDALARASRALNDITGYSDIHTIKQRVQDKANAFEATRDHVQKAKREYEQAIEQRSATQRGINELLQRKHLWTGEDVTKFTELYRLEHEHSMDETRAKEQYQVCEKKMDREYMDLARSIMERYHEEQLWSDKIRSLSTYGTWALMVLNLILFVGVQTVFEPYKRKRLTDRFEELLISRLDEEDTKMDQRFQRIEQRNDEVVKHQESLLSTLSAASAVPLAMASSHSPISTDSSPITAPVMPTHPSHPPVWLAAESAVAGGLLTAILVYMWR